MRGCQGRSTWASGQRRATMATERRKRWIPRRTGAFCCEKATDSEVRGFRGHEVPEGH